MLKQQQKLCFRISEHVSNLLTIQLIRLRKDLINYKKIFLALIRRMVNG
uniref:Uncharacterized protein n=1 Tax=Myoviridae sp. ctCo31 TaxID=2825053 RepID=A0A8S5UN08_9CAUD|nr:MAG TPA: hypothetical protein [Myoviridae sp. ctCo31]